VSTTEGTYIFSDPHQAYFLTEDIMKEAIETILPSIQNLIHTGGLKRKDFCLVIAMQRAQEQAKIIGQYCSTSVDTWQYPFDFFARKKSEMSCREGISTREIHQSSPHLLQKGDTVYYGSTIGDGLCTSCSGFDEQDDDMVSAWLHITCKTLCRKKRESLPEDDGFI